MNSIELAEAVKACVIAANWEGQIDDATAEGVIEAAQERILGVGAEQYTEGDKQRFETMPLPELVEYCREEALDLINYGVMLTLRIETLADAVESATERMQDQEQLG